MADKERRGHRPPSGSKVRTKAMPRRSPKIKQQRSEEFSTLFSLAACIGVLVLATFTIISVFDERNMLEILSGAGLTDSVLASDNLQLYLNDEAVPAAASPNEVVDKYLVDQINATTHEYDWGKLHIDGNHRYYGEDETIISKTGIDVSYYQEEIDWQKVKAAGIEFAIIRVGFRGYVSGTLVLDSQYANNIKGATEAGIDVGLYFFTQAVTVEEAVEEANFVLDNIGDYDIKYPIVIDTEAIDDTSARSQNANLSPDELTDICIAFCDTIDAAGYHSSIYASKNWFLTQLNLERLENYDKWLAHYTDVTSYPFEFDIWQYTDKGTVDGINGNVDMNLCFRNYDTE